MQARRAQTRKAKAQNASYTSRGDERNSKRLYTYIRHKRRRKESLDPLLSGEGELVMDATKNTEVFNASFVSVSLKKVNCSQILNTININSKGEGMETKTGKEQVKDYLDKLDVFKSAGPDEIHPRVFQELAEAVLETLAIIFDNSDG